MAGKKLSLQHRVSCSTILEVLISMIFIIVIFGVAMMIYANVTQHSLSAQQLHAQGVLKDLLINLEKNPTENNGSLLIDSLRVEQDIKIGGNIAGIHLGAYDRNGKLLTELHKMVRVHEKQ